MKTNHFFIQESMLTMRRNFVKFLSFSLVFISSECLIAQQEACNLPTPPQGINIVFIGSDYNIPDLTEAISQGKMHPEPVSPNNWQPQWIYIGGSFSFDEQSGYSNYILPNSRIIMGEGAEIRIEDSDMHVIFDNSDITGCDFMWNRIFVRNASLEFQNVEIRDGFHAVELHQDAWFSSIESRFVDNYVGIYGGNPLLDGNGFYSTTTFSAFQVSATEFIGEEELLPGFTGVEMVTDVAFTGIWMESVQYVSIGGKFAFATAYTTFENLYYGVHLFRTNALVSWCQFSDIYINDSVTPFGSTAILAVGDHKFNFNLEVRGMGKTGDLVFDHCYNGVVANAYNCVVRNTNSDRLYRGVLYSNAAFRIVNIRDNTIIAHRSGISNSPSSALPDMMHNFLVRDNDIYIRPFNADYGSGAFNLTSRCGISLTNIFKQGKNVNFSIRDNVISTEVKASGIFLSVSNGMDISGNTILLSDAGSEDRGIIAQSFHSGTLKYNTLRGSEIGSQIGVAVLFGQGSEYYCNATDSIGRGLVYVANCDNSYVGTNLLGTHLVGLDLLYGGGQFTRIGYQPNTMNQWLSNEDYGVAGARHYSNIDYITAASQFDVHTTSNSYWPDPLIDPSTMWFREFGLEGDDCQVPVPDEDWRSMNVLTSLDSLIISGDTTTYSGESLWSLRYSLFWKLFHNAGIRAASSWADDWFVHSDQDNLASLFMSEYLLSDGHSQIDSVDIENELDQINAYFSILHRLNTLDSLMSDDPQPGWISERDSLLNVWVGMNDLDSLVWEESLARMDSSKAMASTILIGLSSSSLTEQRWQQVLELYLDFLEYGSEAWDSLERLALVEMAEMCIGDGGPATPWARNLVELFEPDFHDDIILCIEPSPLVQSNELNDEPRVTPSLYPNPFVDFLTLDTDCVSGRFVLSNLLGQAVYQADITESQCQVRMVGLGVLPSGVYHWKYQTHDGRHATGTVVRH